MVMSAPSDATSAVPMKSVSRFVAIVSSDFAMVFMCASGPVMNLS